jgi:membrane fusion protein, multidrug efflux system
MTIRVIAMGAGILVALAVASPSLAQTAPTAQPPAVIVSLAGETDLAERREFLGRVQAAEKVGVRARVTGFLDERRFTEGQPVKKGEVLFVIDKAPFQAELDQANANAAAAQAILKNAQMQLDRGRELLGKGTISQAMMDERIAAEGKAKGDVLQAEAAVRQKEINLSWTDITSPIDGRIGPAKVTVGNLVGPETGVLATIVASDPIYVTFPVTQRELLAFQDRAANTQVKTSLVLATGEIYPESGRISLLDVEANQTTDSVTVRAEFPNPKGTLVDGASVRVVLDIGAPEKQVTIPQSAIAIDQQGPFVLVVGAGDVVEVRRIELGQYRQGLAVVLKGIGPGDRVIVEGQQRARPGQPVTPAVLPSVIRS